MSKNCHRVVSSLVNDRTHIFIHTQNTQHTQQSNFLHAPSSGRAWWKILKNPPNIAYSMHGDPILLCRVYSRPRCCVCTLNYATAKRCARGTSSHRRAPVAHYPDYRYLAEYTEGLILARYKNEADSLWFCYLLKESNSLGTSGTPGSALCSTPP